MRRFRWVSAHRQRGDRQDNASACGASPPRSAPMLHLRLAPTHGEDYSFGSPRSDPIPSDVSGTDGDGRSGTTRGVSSTAMAGSSASAESSRKVAEGAKNN